MIKNFYKQPQLINDRGEANKETFTTSSKGENEVLKTESSNDFIQKKEKLTTISELVELLKVDRKTILNAIEKYNLGSTSKVNVINGKTTYLNEKQTTEIINIIRGHHNLASRQVDNVKTSIEIQENFLKAMNDYVKLLEAEKAEYKRLCEEQERKIEENKPLVEFANDVSDSEDCISFNQFSKNTFKILKLGEKNLFNICRQLKILQSGAYNWNTPYQCYIDEGYFKTIQQTYSAGCRKRITYKTLITGKGSILLLNKLKKHLNKDNLDNNIKENKNGGM